MPLLNLCTKNVSANRFAKCTVQSVDANVEKGPLFDTAGNTSRGAVYSQTKTVRHGMRAAIVVVAGRGGGRRGVDSARRGGTNACARGEGRDQDAERHSCGVDVPSRRDVFDICLRAPYARRFTAAASRECQCSEMGLLHSCAKCSRRPRARCTSPWRHTRRCVQQGVCAVLG